MNKVWENYGDVNPLEHGGLWIINDTNDNNSYYVVKVQKLEDEKNTWLYDDCYVNVTESWIDWESVYDYCDITGESSNIDKVVALVSYYSPLEFGSYTEKITGKRNIRKMINSRGIVIKRG